MLPYKRSKRVADLVRKEISDIVLRRLKDPRIGFVTVTDVSVTDDLKLARVFVSSLKEDEREQMLEILNSAKSFIRQELGRRVKMKVTPDLEFRVDTSIQYGDRIDQLLKEIKGD